MIRKKFLFFCFILLCLKPFAQVNLQTGGAVFSIPMFDWKDDKSRLNSIVALSYSSGNGLKVNDVASNVGQGWNLVAGGVITRMQAGEPDDQLAFGGTGVSDLRKYPSGMLYATKSASLGYPEAIRKYPIYKAMNQVYTQHNLVAEDKQLDQFSYQFNGKAGVFVLDPTNIGVTHSLGDTKMKITFQVDANLINQGIRTRITSFTIQDVDGMIYRFSKHGLTKILKAGYCDQGLTRELVQPKFENDKVYHMKGFDYGIYNPWVIGSWFLEEIEDPFTHRKVTFSYTAPRTINSNAGIDISYNQEKNYSIISHKTSITQTPDISSITYADGHTSVFNYGADREDLKGAKVLSSVSFNYQGRALSQYQLSTSYFILNRYGKPVTEFQKSAARLCLKSVRKIGVDLKEDSPPYIFDYYTGSSTAGDFVPVPFSYSRDIWGFYNGDNSRSYTNGAITVHKPLAELSNNELRGLCFRRSGSSEVELNAKNNYARNGLLRQVIYPTGGTLTYEYMQNEGTIGSTYGAVGGVHVSKTSSSDGGGSNDCAHQMSTSYNYVLGDGTTSSLWGLETPVNFTYTQSHYQPEQRKIHWTFSCVLTCCYWNFSYPGILNQQEAISLTGLQQFMNAISPVLGIVSFVSTVMDVATLIGSSAPGFGTIAAVVVDIIGSLVSLFVTCFGSQSRDYTSTIYYNTDLNGIAPLPTQFKRVEVVENPGTIGKTVHEFTDDSDYPLWVGIGQNTAFAAKQRFAPWAYGLPKKVSVLNASNVKISETVNTYSFSTVYPTEAHCGSLTAEQQMHYNRTLLLKRPIGVLSAKCVVKQYTSQRNTDWSNPAIYDDPASYRTSSTSNMTIDIYDFYTGRAELDKIEEKVFKPGDVNSFLLTTTQFIYNDQNYEINSIKKSKSDGTISRKNIYYSIDYVKPYGLCYLPRNDVSTTNAEMIALVNQNVISQVVETSAMENDKFIKDEATIFTTLANGDIKPFKTLTTRLTQPEPSYNLPQSWFYDYYNPVNNVPAALFNPANPNYALYTVTQTFSYDNSGNLIGVKDEGNRNIANIYDYSGKYIIGSVVNADPVVDKPAYTSFETGELGGWQLAGGSPVYVSSAITGVRSFNLTGRTLTATLNTAKPYIVSFWATSSGVAITGGATLVKSAPAYNGFTYYEYNIASGTPSVFISGSSTIDELRVFPKNALMSTTTYDPLIGKTAESDANNRITYYEYDNLGRLRFIKDEAKNIVKMYEYNNVSEARQRGCPGTYYNYAISEVFTSSNCGAGYIGGTVTYTVPANMFSSAISQADADAQAEYYLMTNGQAFANTSTNQVCIPLYYNTEQTQTFYSQDCPPGYIGGAVAYTVPASTYSSTISVADANQRALEEIAANGQYNANLPENSVCTPSTDPYWSWQEGDAKYCSSIDGQPPHLIILMTDLNPNSPTYGHTQWKDSGPSDDCPPGTYYNTPRNVVFYKNDCSPGVGLPITFSVAGGLYSSTVSQVAADQLATDYINANGQAWANANGSCCTPSFTFAPGISVVTNYLTLMGSSTMNFTWVFGHTGSTSLLLGTINPACARPTTQRTIPKYSGSTLYNIVIYPNGNVVLQWISGPMPPTGTIGIVGGFDLLANAYYSVQKSGTYTRNNCPSGQIAGSATYTVQQYAYSSLVDQATADQLAQNDVTANGQTYANANATCTPAPTSCSFSANSSISWYSSTMTLTSSTVSITFAFASPTASYSGGTLGYLPVGTCRPSVNRTFNVTDGANSSRIWAVTIMTGGYVSISKVSGPTVALGGMITLSGTYGL